MPQIVCRKKRKGLPCGYVAKTLGGWKRHMSSVHGGFDNDELAEIVGNTSSQPEAVKARMEQAARDIPLDAGGTPQALTDAPAAESMPAQPMQPTEVLPPPPKEKRVKATPKKVQKIIMGLPTKFFESTNIKLDEDDKEAIEEVADFLADIFGVEFSVAESKYVVNDRRIAFLWAFGVMLAIWIKHNIPTLFKFIIDRGREEKKEADKKQTPQTPPTTTAN